MRKLFVAAALVAACSVANAAEVKKDTKANAPAVSAKAMTDKDMDKVTAGAAEPTPQLGTDTALSTGVATPQASDRGLERGVGTLNKP